MPNYVPTKFYASSGKRLFKSKATGKLFVRRADGARSYRSSGIQVSHMDTSHGKRVVRKHHKSVPIRHEAHRQVRLPHAFKLQLDDGCFRSPPLNSGSKSSAHNGLKASCPK